MTEPNIKQANIEIGFSAIKLRKRYIEGVFILKLDDNVDCCKEQEYCRVPVTDLYRPVYDPGTTNDPTLK